MDRIYGMELGVIGCEESFSAEGAGEGMAARRGIATETQRRM